jgi:hypothetical protein
VTLPDSSLFLLALFADPLLVISASVNDFPWLKKVLLGLIGLLAMMQGSD